MRDCACRSSTFFISFLLQQRLIEKSLDLTYKNSAKSQTICEDKTEKHGSPVDCHAAQKIFYLQNKGSRWKLHIKYIQSP
jgi:hypothetical protein